MTNAGCQLLIGCFASIASLAQTTIPVTPVQTEAMPEGYFGATKTIVKLDPVSGIPAGNVPFDRNFILRIYFLKETDLPKRVYIRLPNEESEQLFFYQVTTNLDKYDATDANVKYFPVLIDILVKPLKPNRNYSIVLVTDQKEADLLEYLGIFKLIYEKKENDARKKHRTYRQTRLSPNIPAYSELAGYYSQNNLDRVFARHGGDLNEATVDLLAQIRNIDYFVNDAGDRVRIFQDIVPAGSFSTRQYSLQTNASLHVVGEGGVIFAGFQDGFNVASAYVGINVSFRPLDSDIPLSVLRKNKQIKWHHRITANVGVTLNSISKTGRRSNLFGNNNIMVGLGYKFNHYLSLISGGLIYQNNDAHPLLDKKTVGVAPYVGLSINLKIKDALGEIGKVLSYAK